MNKFLQKLAKIFLGLSMAAGVGVAIGAGRKDVSQVAAATSAFVAGTDTGSGSVTKNHITVTMSTMDRTDNYRMNSGTKLTVTGDSTVSSITEIILTHTTSSGNYSPAKITGTDVGSVTKSGNKTTWTGSSKTVVFSNNAQVRLTNIDVTYTATSSYTYSISYNGNSYEGGTLPSAQSGSGTSVTISSNVLTRTGYRHIGWSTSDHLSNSNPDYQIGQSVNLSANLTVSLYAHWIQQYNVTYESGDHSSSSDYVVAVDAGSTYALVSYDSCGFTANSGWGFKSWSIGGTERAVGYEITVNSAVTVTAVYQEASTFTFVTDASTLTDGTTFVLVYNSSGTYYIPTSISTHLVLSQKTSSTTISGLTSGSTLTSTEALVLTLEGSAGAWKIKSGDQYLRFTGSSNGNDNFSTEANASVFSASIHNGYIWFTCESQTGNGRVWRFYTTDHSMRNYATNSGVGDVYMFANIPEEGGFTVSFDPGEGSGSKASQTHVAGTFNLPDSTGFTAPNGKLFSGWKVANDDTLYKYNSEYNVTQDVTFIAQWATSCAVTFTAGTNGSGSQVINVPAGTYELPKFSELTSISANTGYIFKNYTVSGNTFDEDDEVTISGATAVTVNFDVKPEEVTYDFTNNWDTYASSWGGYNTYTVTGTDLDADYEASMVLVNASKQSATINDRPVFAAKNGVTTRLSFVLDSTVSSTYNITTVQVQLAYWANKTCTASLYKGESVSGIALQTITTSSTSLVLSTNNLNGDSFVVDFTTTSGSNQQIGITSITIGLLAKAAFGTLDHITVSSLPNTIYHVGEYFDPTGLKVTAYDGQNESTAAYKDVTGDAVVAKGSSYQFADNDYPGIDIGVTYEENNVQKSTSFHVSVYAVAEYELVTSAPTNWAGNYLLVGSYTDSSSVSHTVAINSALVNFDQPLNFKEVTVSNDNTITTGEECEFTVASYNSGYSMQGQNGKYAYGNSNNRFMTSDTAQELSLSFSNNIVTVTGATNFILRMNSSTSGAERFGFYNTGSADIQFYKLKESTAASDYADSFLLTLSTGQTHICVADGSTNLANLKVAWADLASDFNSLSALDRSVFTGGVADEEGTNIQQAIALYIYIATKYGHSLESENCLNFDFMSRNITPRNSARQLLGLSTFGQNTNTVAIIVIISMVSVTAVGGYFLRKRKENI